MKSEDNGILGRKCKERKKTEHALVVYQQTNYDDEANQVVAFGINYDECHLMNVRTSLIIFPVQLFMGESFISPPINFLEAQNFEQEISDTVLFP